jgi:uncharacterized protein (DUF1501 family)
MHDVSSCSCLSRRHLLVGGAATFAWAYLPKIASAAGARDPRLIVIILRGALDGLSTVGPVGDPDYQRLHGQIALSLTGDHPAISLDGFFALNPAMPIFGRLFKDGHAAIVHAAATGYRERSHFDGQDVLESGMPSTGFVESGWLNRAIAQIPQGDRVHGKSGLAVGAYTPLILRGSAPVIGWAPQILPVATSDLANRVLDLYQHRDPVLKVALERGLEVHKLAQSDERKPGDLYSIAGMRIAAEGAAKLMAVDDGPRVAVLDFDGWDTHSNEGGATGRLAQLLAGLDGAFDALHTGLGDRWRDTAIVAITEFGRTAHINGTVGTDHGTGTVALLAGGAIKGNRVITDWPGLEDANLYQNRDLKPTTDVRSVLKGLLADQFGLSNATLAESVFPESSGIPILRGLVA